jgi:hypothetical protein
MEMGGFWGNGWFIRIDGREAGKMHGKGEEDNGPL